jgi:hypothetical protein
MTLALSIRVGSHSVDPQPYSGWAGARNACEFDAEDMFALAAKTQFSASKLLTNAATSTALTDAPEYAANELADGGEACHPHGKSFTTRSRKEGRKTE